MALSQQDMKTQTSDATGHLPMACIVATVVLVAAMSAHAGTVFTVDGTTYGFQDTSVDLEVGKYVWIDTTGDIRYASASNRTTDPDGFGPDQDGTGFGSGLVPAAIRLSLVGRLGNSLLMPAGSSPYTANPGEGFIGSSYLRAMPQSGRLYLGYNDGGMTDNEGSFTANISPTFTVHGDIAGFQNTGVNVKQGDVVWIEAEGTINYNLGGSYTDPNGYGSGKNGTENATGAVPVPGAIFGSLVGRIGNSALMPEGSSPYTATPGEGFIGKMYAGVAPEDGQLYLAYNDGGATDNSGTFDVAISPYFVVDGTIEGTWLDTGLDLNVGDVLTISASGQIAYSSSGAWTDPDGFGSVKDGTEYAVSSHLVPGAIFGSLVGRIGDTLLAPEGVSPYIASPGDGFIGSDYRQTITNAGRLYLAYNDGSANDNGGFFLARVNVVPEPASVFLLLAAFASLTISRPRRKRGQEGAA